VFSASSCEGLTQLLNEENQGGQQVSVTAEQFLRERGIQADRLIRRASLVQNGSDGLEGQEKTAITATLPPLSNESSQQIAPVEEEHISTLDRKRLEREMGAGGDHDLPYTFALPVSVPQMLAWIRLMNRVRRGELQG
jgi:hypothetical protein